MLTPFSKLLSTGPNTTIRQGPTEMRIPRRAKTHIVFTKLKKPLTL